MYGCVYISAWMFICMYYVCMNVYACTHDVSVALFVCDLANIIIYWLFIVVTLPYLFCFKWQVHEYIDYDRKAAEEADLLNSSQWMWDDASASAARNHGPEPASSSHRAVVSYAELMHPRIFQKNARWRGKPDQGQERSNNKSVLASGNKLQSVPHSNGAPRFAILYIFWLISN